MESAIVQLRLHQIWPHWYVYMVQEILDKIGQSIINTKFKLVASMNIHAACGTISGTSIFMHLNPLLWPITGLKWSHMCSPECVSTCLLS